ncbi:MAG: type II secretion system protein [Phycisphaeraceae bacterium]
MHPPASPPTRRAFTLVELLIVLGLIALLVGLLLPALASARDTAHIAQCASRLHQLSLATAAYLNDYDATYPQPTQSGYYDVDKGYPAGEKQRNCWYNALDPYINEEHISYTGSNRNNAAIKQDPAWHNLPPDIRKHNKTLKMNAHFGFVDDEDNVKWVRQFQIRRTSRSVVFGDGRANDLSNEHEYLSIPAYFHLNPRYIGLRHKDAANIAFADSHVQTVQQTTYTISINGGDEQADAWHDPGDPRQTLIWQIDQQ